MPCVCDRIVCSYKGLYIKISEVRSPSLDCNGAYCDGQPRCGEGR